MAVIDRDRGYKEALTAIRGMAGRPYVVVGIRSGKGSEVAEGDDVNLATIAAINEFGEGRVPERSFLRSTVDDHRAEYESEIAKIADRAITGKEEVRRGLARLGVRVAGDVQSKISDGPGIPPPNAPSTIRRKGSTRPLVDTGRLRQSIDSEVREDE